MYRRLFWRKPGSKKNIEDYWGIQSCSQKHRVLQVIQWKVYIDNETFLWGSLSVEPLGEGIWRFVFQAVYIVLWRLGHVQWYKKEKRALFRDSGISLIDYDTNTSVSLWVKSSFISVFFGINSKKIILRLELCLSMFDSFLMSFYQICHCNKV